MMRVWRLGGLLLLCVLLVWRPAGAQTPPGLRYDTTVSALLEETEVWSFEGASGERVRLEAVRIAGQFQPLVRLISPDGTPISTAEAAPYPDSARIEATLRQNGTHRIEIDGVNRDQNPLENPDEVALTLSYRGQDRADPHAGLPPLPDLPTMPDFMAGALTRALGLTVGGGPSVSSVATARFELRAFGRTLLADNTSALNAGLEAIGFLQNGIGYQVAPNRIDHEEARFFTDQNITRLAYDSPNNRHTIELADGTRIVTDFYRIRRLWAVNGRIQALLIGDPAPRVIVAGDTFTWEQRDNSETVVLRSAQGALNLNVEGWQTLVLDGNGLRLHRDRNARLLSDEVNFPALDVNTGAMSLQRGDVTIPLNVDWRNLGELNIANGRLTLTFLDERQITLALSDTREVLVVDEAIRQRTGDSFVTWWPDAPPEETPLDVIPNVDALPSEGAEGGYAPRGLNRSGLAAEHLCPCPRPFDVTPVNPANGNLNLQVDDLSIPGGSLSAALALRWTRTYNSLAPDVPFDGRAHLGPGWRHSYAYQIDVRRAPLGDVTFIFPDGTPYRFTASAADVYASPVLPNWTLSREGPLGRWRAVNDAGLIYHFDRAGRLTRIAQGGIPHLSLILTPAPNDDLYIVDPYGRRLTLTTGANGRVLRVRDGLARQVGYDYDAGGRLSAVMHAEPALSASYVYEAGRLVRADDPLSPLHPALSVAYDERGRVRQLTQNPDGGQPFTSAYVYGDGFTERSRVLAGDAQITRWAFDDAYLPEQHVLPDPAFAFEFVYNPDNERLAQLREPTGTLYRLSYDARGHLTRLEDPIFTQERGYRLETEFREGVSLLTAIRYPERGGEAFIYSAGEMGPPRLIERRALGASVTGLFAGERYAYDDWGRLVMLATPTAAEQSFSATLYTYDAFGYVASIRQGVPLGADETYADIRQREGVNERRFDHDVAGRLRALTTRNGGDIALNWDRLNRLTEAVADDVRLSYGYDDLGRLNRMDVNGALTRYIYNTLGEVAAIIHPDRSVDRYAYDAARRLRTHSDASGATTRYAYDALGRLSAYTDALGQTTRYQTRLDTLGASVRHQREDPTGRLTRLRVSPLQRVRQVTWQDGTYEQTYQIEYNALGLPVNVREAFFGRSLALDYDVLGRVTRSGVADTDVFTRYAYDRAGNLSAVVDAEGRRIAYEHDGLNRLVALTWPDETTHRLGYDAAGNLSVVTDPAGVIQRYTYDAYNRLSSVNLAGDVTRYAYDGGRLSAISAPDGAATRYAYDERGRLSALTDAEGHTITYRYDALGKLVSVQRPEGRSTRYAYDALGRLISTTQRPREQRTLYGYDALGRLTSITDPLGRVTSLTYNALGRLDALSDPVGQVTRYRWQSGTRNLIRANSEAGYSVATVTDSLGRVTTLRDVGVPDALNAQMSYDDLGFITRLQVGTEQARNTGAGDLVHLFSYTPNGDLATLRDPLGNSWTLSYDAPGRVNAITAPDGITTRYQYDAAGRLRAVIEAAGTDVERVTRYAYDVNGHLSAVIAPDGVTTRYQRDARGAVIAVIEAAGTDLERVTRYQRDAQGQVIQRNGPDGTVTRYVYLLDQLARMERVSSDGTAVTRYRYDDVGHLRQMTLPEPDPLTRESVDFTLTYDALNRRVRFMDGDANVWAYAYNATGQLTQVSNPAGGTLNLIYDDLERVRRIVQPDGSAIDLDYDVSGQLSRLTLPPTGNTEDGRVTRQTLGYAHDLNGRLVRVEHAADRAIRYERDAMGRVTRRVMPSGKTTRYAYDALGRLTRLSYDDGRVIEREYDAAGRLTRLSDGERTLTYVYDALGRLIEEASDQATITYAYDAADNLIRRDAGPYGVTTFSYDAHQRLSGAHFDGAQITITTDQQGRIREMERDNGVRTLITYDGNDQPISVLHLTPDNRRLEGFNYQHGATGLVNRVDHLSDAWRVLLSSDVNERLIDERWLDATGNTRYSLRLRYDDAGNRIEQQDADGLTRYVYDEHNRLVEALHERDEGVMSVRYAYDADGNLTRLSSDERALNLSYDGENRLIGISETRSTGPEGGALDIELLYDPAGRLVGYRHGATLQEWVYAGRQPLAMVNGSRFGALLDGSPLIEFSATGEHRWLLNDRFGTARGVVNAEGAFVPAEQREINAFGVPINPYGRAERWPQADGVGLVLAQGGRLYDPTLGWYHLGLRTYDPRLGRFLQPDPVRHDPIGTLYTYARNQPLRYGDPSGTVAERLLEPVTVPDVPALLHPTRTPRPAERTYQRQADDLFRALQIVDRTRYGINGTVGQLSPLLDGFYSDLVRPLPDNLRALDAAPYRAFLSHYAPGQGWTATPDPAENLTGWPFAALEAARVDLARAQVEPLRLCCDEAVSLPDFLPASPLPDDPRQFWRQADALLASLTQVAVMPALAQEIPWLTDVDAHRPRVELPAPEVILPSMDVEPGASLVPALEALRQQTGTLAAYALGDALEVPPLRLSR